MNRQTKLDCCPKVKSRFLKSKETTKTITFLAVSGKNPKRIFIEKNLHTIFWTMLGLCANLFYSLNSTCKKIVAHKSDCRFYFQFEFDQ